MSQFIAGFGTATTSDNMNYSVLMSPKRSTLIKGAIYIIEFPSINIFSATLNIDNLGIKTIKTKSNNNLIAGDIQAAIYYILYNGTYFILNGLKKEFNDVNSKIDLHTSNILNPHNVTAIQAGAEPAFTKNTAFNKNFATITEAQAAIDNLKVISPKTAKDFLEANKTPEINITDIQNIATISESYVSGKRFWTGITKFISLAWTWAAKQTFTIAPRFNSTTSNQILEVDINKELVSSAKNTAYNKAFATQLEAEAGTNTISIMTPERTSNFWDKVKTLTQTISNIWSFTAGIVVGGTSKNTSSILDIQSLDKGILISRMTNIQRNAISSPATGLMIYQTDGAEGLYIRYNDGNWVQQ